MDVRLPPSQRRSKATCDRLHPASSASLNSLMLAFALSGSACGGSQAQAEQASNAAPADGPGAACLADARAARTPRPDAPESIEVAHVLVRHKGLARPEGATRSPEEACLRALEALKKLESGASWEDVVKDYSDGGSATQGGLGKVSRDDLDPTFADAAFSLEVDELSYVVESERGFHIILRQQ